MPELCSVGIDVGTTTTQLVVSRLQVENQASGFAVPQMQITERELCYRSPIYFTPLQNAQQVDGDAIRRIVAEEYEKAGLDPADVDTGAVIITGETSRKENARAVLEALSGYAGDFVVATAGPDLESILAARGSGAVEYSAKTGKWVLHMDIGGGTSNLALIQDGKIRSTGCLNVGGRLLQLDKQGRIVSLSPVLYPLTSLRVGDTPDMDSLQQIAQQLTQVLEMAAGLREKTDLWEKLVTQEAAHTVPAAPGAAISFSGGVADCIEKDTPLLEYGDIGPLLGKTIRKSKLCQGNYILGSQTIRATVVGAGCHSTQLSGSTVFCRGVTLPVKNLPVAVLNAEEQFSGAAICRKMQSFDTDRVVLAMPGLPNPDYMQVQALAQAIEEGTKGKIVYVCLEQDMAKVLGNCLSLMGVSQCLCIDRVSLVEGSYLDVGAPVGPVFPVVAKTLVFSEPEGRK